MEHIIRRFKEIVRPTMDLNKDAIEYTRMITDNHNYTPHDMAKVLVLINQNVESYLEQLHEQLDVEKRQVEQSLKIIKK